MDQATTVAFLNALGVENPTVTGGWVRASCPLAPWTHKKGTDTSPSFGIRISASDDVDSIWHCFSCVGGAGGGLDRLLNAYQWASKERAPKEAVGIYLATDGMLGEEAGEQTPIAIRDRFAHMEVQSIAPKPLVPATVLNQFPPLDMKGSKGAQLVHKWLVEQRKISPDVIAQYGLRLQRNPLGIVFPICNREGGIIDLWVRLLKTKKFYRLTPKMTGSRVQYKAVEEWFGWQYYQSGKPVTTVEGALDVLRLCTLKTKNVLGSMGPPTSMKWSALYAPLVVLGFDADDSGYGFAKRARKYLRKCTIWQLDWELVGRKDPGALKAQSELVKALAQKREYIV